MGMMLKDSLLFYLSSRISPAPKYYIVSQGRALDISILRKEIRPIGMHQEFLIK
jgi:hypothetical protein